MRMLMSAAAILATLASLLGGPVPARAQTPAPAAPRSTTTAPGAPGGTRLLFGPTARMLEPGRGYFALDGPLLLSANVGVTPWFSIGGGFVPLVGDDDPSLPFWVIPKFRLFARGRTSVALCVAHAVVSRDERIGLAYLVGTRGTDERSLTVGGALAYLVDRSPGDHDDTGANGALLVGGMRRLNATWTVLTENYLTPAGGILTVGFRLDRRSFTADFSGVTLVDFGGADAAVFPAISLGWKF